MTLTPEHAARRRRVLTASDAVAFLGLSPFKRPADVIAEKVYDLAEAPTTDAMELGTLLHPGLVTFEARRRGIAPVELEVWIEAGDLNLGATLDAVDTPKRVAAVEGKTSGLLNPYADTSEWGEPATDQVPKHVMIQDCVQLLVCPTLHVVYNSVILRGQGYCSYAVERDAPGVRDLLDWLMEQIPPRWKRYVVEREPVPDSEPPASVEVLKRVRRVPRSVVPVDPALVEAWRADQAAAKLAAARAEESKARLIAALGTAEGGECELGSVTYLEQSRKAYTVEASTYRTLRWRESP